MYISTKTLFSVLRVLLIWVMIAAMVFYDYSSNSLHKIARNWTQNYREFLTSSDKELRTFFARIPTSTVTPVLSNTSIHGENDVKNGSNSKLSSVTSSIYSEIISRNINVQPISLVASSVPSKINHRSGNVRQLNPATKVTHPSLSSDCFVYKNSTAMNICCQMYDYMTKSKDILTCLRKDFNATKLKRSPEFSLEGGKWVIVGDSRMRFFYYGIIHSMASPRLMYRYTISSGKWRSTQELIKQKEPYIFRKNMVLKHLDAPGTRIVFYWDPRLKKLTRHLYWWLRYDVKRPMRLIIGTGTHYMSYSKKAFIDEGIKAASLEFRKQLNKVWMKLNKLGHLIPVAFHFLDYFQESLVLPRLKNVWGNPNVDHYNSILRGRFVSSSVIPWNSNVNLSRSYNSECALNLNWSSVDMQWRCRDPVHMGFVVIYQYWNMFLNDACNRFFEFGDDSC